MAHLGFLVEVLYDVNSKVRLQHKSGKSSRCQEFRGFGSEEVRIWDVGVTKTLLFGVGTFTFSRACNVFLCLIEGLVRLYRYSRGF